MEQFKTFIDNEHVQLLLMIPALLGAFYFAWRIVFPDPPRRPVTRPRAVACAALTLVSLASLGYMFASHLEVQIRNPAVNRVVVWIAGSVAAFFTFFLILLTVTDLLRLLLRGRTRKRRAARPFVLLSLGLAAVLTVGGIVHARQVQTVYYTVYADSSLSRPVRIAEVSDLHMGSLVGVGHVERVVEAVNACQPDLVVFLGDQFNRTEGIDVVNGEAMFAALSRIEAPLGVYAVLGNHDPELDSPLYRQYLTESGITPLDNAVAEILPGEGEVHTLVTPSADGSGSVAAPETPAEGSLLVAGRTKLARDTERVPLADLLQRAGVRPGDGGYLLVLDHDPDGIPEAVSCGADLVLAGHTHYGQFYPVTLISSLSYPKGYCHGLAETADGETGHVTASIVSSGAGYFQPPIRVGTDSEVVCVDVVPGAEE